VPNLFQRLASVFRRAPAVEPAAPPPSPPPDPNRTTPLPDLASVVNIETVKSTAVTLAPKHLIVGIAQHVGRVRAHNEDVLLSFTGELAGLDSMPHFGLFVVADGMGGHALGERASGIAARTVAREALGQILPFLLAYPDPDTERPSLQEIMEQAMNSANQAVFAGVPEGGGTTLTCALLIGEQVVLSHVGDSRAYLITPDSFEQLTRDHSLVQRLQELGQLSAAEAAVHPQRNVLYRAVGQGDGLEVDVEAHRLPPGGALLLCSDGLWGLVPNERIQTVIRQAPSLQAACEALVAAANAAGGPDNITAVMVQLPQ
jgi:serine/threonine protein phosphatase PrpC